MLIDYIVMSGALLGGGSALGLLILNRPGDDPPGDGSPETKSDQQDRNSSG
ncbi:hypothetical protein [Histidinibacterium lentulum]|uniref:hypothetical protein n=1 Tax=Histidinibacterium lentulum TaxID=2480588 RepID=UPI001614413F|nr:hypothetical protein [Histidinibacterium lentulum]